MNDSPPSPLKVLVVDDHADSAILAAYALRKAGHIVWTAAGCEKALEVVATERIDVLVADMRLPDGDGCQLLSDILGCYPITAIVCTGNAIEAERERYERSGFTAFFRKPVSLEQLTNAVSQAGQRAATSGQHPVPPSDSPPEQSPSA